MSNRDKGSRLDKFEKRRKNTKLMTLMMIAAGALAVLLIGVFIFSDSSAEKQREQAAKTGVVKEPAKAKKEQPAKEENEGDSLKIQEDEAKAEEKQDEKQDKDKEKDENELKTEQVKPSDDNVAEAFTANWEPVGTSQQGAHTTNYNEGSKDRKEMEKAIKLATGLKSMTTWWLGRSGEQGVEATVSNKKDDSEVYRVKLKWVDGKGWKPDRVELLKKNDQAYRYR